MIVITLGVLSVLFLSYARKAKSILETIKLLLNSVSSLGTLIGMLSGLLLAASVVTFRMSIISIDGPLIARSFLISFIGSLKLMRKNYSILHAFIFLTIFYTLYISFFGYPRDDAFQAAYVWIGFSLWLILDKPNLCFK